MKIKIGVLSDTHLNQVTRDFQEIYEQYLSDKDIVLHAGDYVSEEVVNYLDRGVFHGVCGNMDPIDVKEKLPIKKVIDLGPYKLGLIHGWGSSDGLEARIANEFEGVDIIVYGHSHRVANHTRDGVIFFNPGTAIGYHSQGTHSIGILEIDDNIKGKIINI